MKNREKTMLRWIFYLAGLLILALGIALNAKIELGVSPIVSVAFLAAQLGGWSMGSTTLASYIVFILIQLVLAGRKRYGLILLQLPMSVLITRFIDLFSAWIPAPAQLTGQYVMLFFAIVFTGVGAAMTLDMRLIPSPGDGVVQAISDFTKKEMGLCKSWFDGIMVVLAVVLSLLLRGRIIGVGIGTLAAFLGIGPVMALFNKLFLKKLEELAGIS